MAIVWLSMAGIDVRAMSHPDPRVIEQEIASKIPVARPWRRLTSTTPTHSVPDSVSWSQYLRVMELVAHYGAF